MNIKRLDNVPNELNLIAHRFGRAYGPGSSRQALKVSKHIESVVGVETDCMLSADKDIFLFKDTLLEKSTTVQGWSHKTSSKEISESCLLNSDGTIYQPATASKEHPLRLEEALELLQDAELGVQLEIKATSDLELVLETTDNVLARLENNSFPQEEIEIISFWPEAAVRAAEQGYKTRIIVACPYAPNRLVEWLVENSITGIILEPHWWYDEVCSALINAGISLMPGVCKSPLILDKIMPYYPDFVAVDDPEYMANYWCG